MMLIVNELEEEFAGQVTIYRLDALVPDNARLQREYGLQGHPSFAVLDGNGRLSARFWGLESAERLRQALEPERQPL
jgi:hypothetical protein